jgi:hypothetical protein
MHPLTKEPEELVLDDGRRVLVRSLQAADREVYAEAIAALSPPGRRAVQGVRKSRMM